MSSRIKITLPDETAARLDEMAAASGEPTARVAGQMVRDALAKITASARANGTDPLDELPVARAPWLEP
jgi:predicted DNA repair protein MutK